MGWAGAWGCDLAQTESAAEWQADGMKDCRLDWRAHCPAGCEGGISSERDSRSRPIEHKACYVS